MYRPIYQLLELVAPDLIQIVDFLVLLNGVASKSGHKRLCRLCIFLSL